jgi:hypothetical protein
MSECTEPHLGLATTRDLLEEIMARGETENVYQDEGNALAIGAGQLLDSLPGSMLDYRTVGEWEISNNKGVK